MNASEPLRGSEQRSPWSVRFKEVPISAIVPAMLMVGCAFVPTNDIEDLTTIAVFGLTIAQCMLAAVWLALGPGHILLRILVAPLWVLISAALAGLEDRPSDAFFALLYTGVVAAIVVTAAISVARLVFGLKLERQDRMWPRMPTQYRLRHLLGLVFATSLLLGVGRLIVVPVVAALRSLWNDGAIHLGVEWAVSLLPMIFVVLAANRFGSRSVALAAATVWFAAVQWVCPWYARYFYYFMDPPHTIVFIGIVAFLATLGGLMLQRAEGYRLMR